MLKKKVISLLAAMACVSSVSVPAVYADTNNYYGDVYYGDVYNGDVYFSGTVSDYGYSYNSKGYVDIDQIDWKILGGSYSKRWYVHYDSSVLWCWTENVGTDLVKYHACYNNREQTCIKSGANIIVGDSIRSKYCADVGYTYYLDMYIQEGENLVMYPYGYESGAYCYIAQNVVVESLVKDENGVIIGVKPKKSQQEYQQNWQNNQFPQGQPPQGPPPGGNSNQNGQNQWNQEQNQYPSFGVNMMNSDSTWYVNTGSTTMKLTYNSGLLKEELSGNVISYMSKGLKQYSGNGMRYSTCVQTGGYIWTILTNNSVIKAHPYGSATVVYPKGDPIGFEIDNNGFGVRLVTSSGSYSLDNLQNNSSNGSWNPSVDYDKEVVNYNDGQMAIYFEDGNPLDTVAIVDNNKLAYNGKTLISTGIGRKSKCGFYSDKYVVYIDSSGYSYKLKLSNGTRTKISNSQVEELEYDRNGFVTGVITSTGRTISID